MFVPFHFVVCPAEGCEHTQGRIQDFHLGGRKRLIYVPACTLRAWNRTHFRQGSRARLRALEALGLFNVLSCNLSLIFKHSDFFFYWIKNIVDPILGGARVCCASHWIRH